MGDVYQLSNGVQAPTEEPDFLPQESRNVRRCGSVLMMAVRLALHDQAEAFLTGA